MTNNYLDGELEASRTECEICLDINAQDANAPDGWALVARICNLRTDAQAHLTMFRIGKCGLIGPTFETLGRF